MLADGRAIRRGGRTCRVSPLELVKKSGVGSIRAAEFSLAPPAEKVGVGALHKSPQLGDPSLPLTRNPRADAQISDLSR